MSKSNKYLTHVLLIFFLLISVISCNINKSPIATVKVNKYVTAPITDDYSYIPDPEERWNKYNLHNYAITQTRICFCTHRGPYKIYVVNNQIKDVLDVNADTLLSNEMIHKTSFLTINELFNLSKSISPDSVAYLNMEYNERFGYPERIFIDPDSAIADEEYGYITSSLERIVKIIN